MRSVSTELQPEPRLEATQENPLGCQAFPLQPLRQKLLSQGCAQGTLNQHLDHLHLFYKANNIFSVTFSLRAAEKSPLQTMTPSVKAVHQNPKSLTPRQRFRRTPRSCLYRSSSSIFNSSPLYYLHFFCVPRPQGAILPLSQYLRCKYLATIFMFDVYCLFEFGSTPGNTHWIYLKLALYRARAP
jgi:hypothetical protein